MKIEPIPQVVNVTACSACGWDHERIYPSRDFVGYYFNCPVNQKRVDVIYKAEA